MRQTGDLSALTHSYLSTFCKHPALICMQLLLHTMSRISIRRFCDSLRHLPAQKHRPVKGQDSHKLASFSASLFFLEAAERGQATNCMFVISFPKPGYSSSKTEVLGAVIEHFLPGPDILNDNLSRKLRRNSSNAWMKLLCTAMKPL